MTSILTARDWELVDTLTGRIRILALDQLRKLWQVSARNRRMVARRMRAIADAGLIEVHTINAHLLNSQTPLFAWQPGHADPHPRQVSEAARSRWEFAAEPVEVCVATSRAANLLGSTAAGLPKLEHRDHDLLLATVFVHFHIHHPQAAACWVGEHRLPKAGYRVKDPDAFLCDGRGTVRCVIESGGSYSPAQVQNFHEHCAERELPYQLW